jgi:hypothetical protein
LRIRAELSLEYTIYKKEKRIVITTKAAKVTKTLVVYSGASDARGV